MPESPTPIAERTLTRCADGSVVVIALFAPIKSPQSAQGDWECCFRISGLDSPIEQKAFGVDSLQALVQAIRGIKYFLDEDGTKLTWLSGLADDTGVPLVLPNDDPDFAKLIQRMVEVEGLRRYVYSQRPARPIDAVAEDDEQQES